MMDSIFRAAFPNCVMNTYIESLYMAQLSTKPVAISSTFLCLSTSLLDYGCNGRRIRGWGRALSHEIIAQGVKTCFYAYWEIFTMCKEQHKNKYDALKSRWPMLFVDFVASRHDKDYYIENHEHDEASAYFALDAIIIVLNERMYEHLPKLRRMLICMPREVELFQLKEIKSMCVDALTSYDHPSIHYPDVTTIDTLVSILAYACLCTQWRFESSACLEDNEVEFITHLLETSPLTHPSKAALAKMVSQSNDETMK